MIEGDCKLESLEVNVCSKYRFAFMKECFGITQQMVFRGILSGNTFAAVNPAVQVR